MIVPSWLLQYPTNRAINLCNQTLQLIQHAGASLISPHPKRTCHTSGHMAALAFSKCLHQAQSSDTYLKKGKLDGYFIPEHHVFDLLHPLCSAYKQHLVVPTSQRQKISSKPLQLMVEECTVLNQILHAQQLFQQFKYNNNKTKNDNKNINTILHVTKLKHFQFACPDLAVLFALYLTCKSLWIKTSVNVLKK